MQIAELRAARSSYWSKVKAFKRQADAKKAVKKAAKKNNKRPGDEKSREGGNLKPAEVKRLRAAAAGGAEEAEAALGQKAPSKEKEAVKESAEVGYHSPFCLLVSLNNSPIVQAQVGL